MEQTYRVVRLLSNHVYPTYQLYAVMDSKKTTPEEGLRLAALTVLDWLCQRLGDERPAELADLPTPAEYRQLKGYCLTSFHINHGYIVDVVSLPELGLWTLQITEPDLGSDPGNPDQARPAVPGRVIETNIGFLISGRTLECGFQTRISDPVGTESLAEVYRLSPVRRLMEHPDFGLRQIRPLDGQVGILRTAEDLKRLFQLWKEPAHQLPQVVFTQVRPDPSGPSAQLPTMELRSTLPLPGLPIPPKKAVAVDPPYDIGAFAAWGAGFCRTYILEDSLWNSLSQRLAEQISPGDILVLEPAIFGGAIRVFPFKPSRVRQTETMDSLWALVGTYPRGREFSFGKIAFLSAARDNLISRTEQAMRRADEDASHFDMRLEKLKTEWQAELKTLEDRAHSLAEQLESQKRYIARLEEEKAALRVACKETEQSCADRLARQTGEMAFLRRKLDQPRRHEDIAIWAETYFADRLILHEKAVNLLREKDAKRVDIGLICDALDFLSTDYWERRYRRISDEEMHTRCSAKYGRPFEVKPTGNTTIEFTPSQYKIKYFPGAKGKPVENPLDWHLGVGNDPESLLRIYFLHDDEKQRIVVGSLPTHLRAVTVK